MSPPTPTGTKHDQGKLRYDLIPPIALEQVVEVLTFGANKYRANDWRKGFEYSRLFAATLRHLFAWWKRSGTDPETGLSHLAHAACCLLFLLESEELELGKDDRIG